MHPRFRSGQENCVAYSMIDDKGILIKNVYYMLSYAYRVLEQNNYRDIAGEEFDNIYDLFATILVRGISQQLKQGLHKEYVLVCEDIPTVRGKLNINGTILDRMKNNGKLACDHDELSENNIFNQIMKTTLCLLLKQDHLCIENKVDLRKILLFFDRIDTLDVHSIEWGKISFSRNNQSYKMMLNICYFVITNLLLSTERGSRRVAEFSDDNMCKLYERFILEYYRRHLSGAHVSALQIPWNTDNVIDFLPTMQTDITISINDLTLIIDAKYYGKTMQIRYDKQTYHSSNLYQIFAYVKNLDCTSTGNVSGVLLYAKTGESVTPDADLVIGGNRFGVKTLDLNVPFDIIADQLNTIANEYLMTNY